MDAPTRRHLPGAWTTQRILETLTLLRVRAGRPTPVANLALARIERSI